MKFGKRILNSLALAAALAIGAAGVAVGETVTLTFVGGQGDAWKGFLQALDESNRQGRFLGFDFAHEQVAVQRVSGDGEVPGVDEDTVALFTAVAADRFAAIARAHPDLPVFNLTSRDDGLRQLCLPNAFHAAPSNRMLADALDQWDEAGKEPADVTPAVWNTSYPRYAGKQLSNRFEEEQGQPMTDEAYAGWAAAKLYTQVVMSYQTAAPEPMLEALHTDVAFDGVKGVPMQFRESGQLNQMILLEKEGRVVGEAPVSPLHDSHELTTLGFNGCKET